MNDDLKEYRNKINTKMAILPFRTVAKAAEIDRKTLLNYEKENIVTPERTQKNRRFYSLEDLEKVRLTRALTKDKKMSYDEVKTFISDLEKNKIDPMDYTDYIENIENKNN